jgi:hypothetical protein
VERVTADLQAVVHQRGLIAQLEAKRNGIDKKSRRTVIRETGHPRLGI